MHKAVLAGGCTVSTLCALPLLVLAVGPGEFGLAASAQESSTFSTNVDLVVLHATVCNRSGGFVSGLQEGNFQVYENGSRQAIRVFQHEDVPVAVGLAVDNSGSMARKRPDVIAAALAFVRSSNPRDEMFVVNFNERVSLGLPDTKLFSASAAELEKALNGIPASGKTALYDAIDAGLDHLRKATRDKKVLIVISDGGDNASHRKLGQVLEAAARTNTIIYTIGLFDENDEDRNPGVLRRIARSTGGEAFLPKEPGEVVGICKRIAEDIRHQYTIGYVPSDQKFDDSYRSIRVTATGQRGQKYVVRTRTGYFGAVKPAIGTAAYSSGRL